MEKSIAQTSFQKHQVFSTGDESYKKQLFTFQFLGTVGISVQISMVGPCTIAKLKSFLPLPFYHFFKFV